MGDTALLAISNIAWAPHEDDAIAAVLRRAGVAGVEIAPTKWREQPLDASAEDIAEYRRRWEDRGLRIVSLQSLLFGRPELQLFGTPAIRSALADYLRRVIDLAADLGAHSLVFGSPKNRLRGLLPLDEASDIATSFFRELGEYAVARRAVICIEANPPEYGGDFVTTTAEAVQICAAANHSGVRVNADLGGMALAGEDSYAAICNANELIAHVHASEPHLGELVTSANHNAASRALREIGYKGWVSVEMRAGPGNNVSTVEQAVRTAREIYT
jgi:D-psicose/D-tagatose/L-ribulose 3-epimerase